MIRKKYQTVATHDRPQDGDQTDEQQDSMQPFDSLEGCFRF